MPTVRYHSLNGRVVSTTVQGGYRTSLMPDALGSVARTLNEAGGGRTTRYAGYGSPLYSAGGWDMPRNSYAGRWGYRRTDLRHAEQYVRARHLSTGAGRWSTVDPLWPGERAYGYAGGRPTDVADPSGMQVAIQETMHEKEVRAFLNMVWKEGLKPRKKFLDNINLSPLVPGGGRPYVENDFGWGPWGKGRGSNMGPYELQAKVTFAIAGMFSFRDTDAYLLLEKFMSNTGKTYYLDVHRFLFESGSGRDSCDLLLNQAVRYVEGHRKQSKQPHYFHSKYSNTAAVDIHDNENWYNAFGHFQFYTRARALSCGNKHRLRFQYWFYDWYNWDIMKDSHIITGLGQMHSAGKARDFPVVGVYEEAYDWIQGQGPQQCKLGAARGRRSF